MKIPRALTALLPALILLAACEDKPAAPPAAKTEDNPLLKLQQDTVQKAQTNINAAVEKNQQTLDSADKQ